MTSWSAVQFKEREKTLWRHTVWRKETSPADWCYFPSEEWEQGANMAPRHRVCHSLAKARLISRLMYPREKKDVKLLHVSIFTTNRGHSVFSKKDSWEGKWKQEGGKGNQDAEWRWVWRENYTGESGWSRGKWHSRWVWTFVGEWIDSGKLTKPLSNGQV